MEPAKLLQESFLFETNPLPCFLVEGNSLQIIAANAAAVRTYDYSPEEFRSMNLADLQSAKTGPELYQLFNDQTTEFSRTKVFQQRKKNGQILIGELHIKCTVVDGKPLCHVLVVDVTSNISLQQALAADKERYKVFIEQSSEGIFRLELRKPAPLQLSADELIAFVKENGYLAEVNNALASMFGFEDASGLQRVAVGSLMDFEHVGNRKAFHHFIENGFKIADAETCEKNKQGQTLYFLNNFVGIVEDGYLKRIWGTKVDITEKKATEEKIKILASLVQETSDILTAADIDFKPLTWNNASEKLYGIKASEVLGKDIRNFLDINYRNYTRQEVVRCLYDKGEWRGEAYFIHPLDGREKTILTSFKQLRNEEGKPLGYVIAGTDITERKATESQLKESEKRFRTMADSAPVMIWMCNEENKLVYLNKPMSDFTGIQLETHEDLTWSYLVHPDDLQKNLEAFGEAFHQQKPVTLIYRLKKASGGYRWVQDSGTPRFLDDQTFLGYIGSIVDIHDTKAREEKLQYQATVLENVMDAIVTTDLSFNVKTWNRIAEEAYGFKVGEAIGKKIYQLVHFEYEDSNEEEVLRTLQENGVWKGEVVYYNQQQEKKYFVHTITFIYDNSGDKIGVLSVGKDITDKRIAEANLQQSEKFYRSLIADSLDGMLLIDPDGKITFASQSITEILGWETEEVLHKNGFHFIHPEDHAFAFDSLQLELKEQAVIKNIVVRLLKKDGTWLWCMVRGNNLLANPFVKSIVVYFHDDSLRKKATDALKESEKRFRTLIRDLQVAVVLKDREGKIIMSNNVLYQALQRKEEEVLGKTLEDFFSDVVLENGNFFPLDKRPFYLAVRHKIIVKNVVMGVMIPNRPERQWLIVNADPIINENGEVENVVVSYTDITDKKQLDERLMAERIYQQKLLTQATIDGQEKERREIGKELHDNIGQQLTTTKLLLEMAAATPSGESARMLQLASKSVNDLIDEVRSISRSLTPPTLGDLGLVDSIFDLVETICMATQCSFQFQHQNFAEYGVPNNMQLMLFRIVQEQLNNIFKHAQPKEVSILLKNNEGPLELHIKDDGIGFDPAQVKLGLGLTNIKNRAELFGGKVLVESSPGKGCCLKIIIPAHS